MKKNGFIATSLIYSFFLVFIAIMAALLNNFIANKTILDRYNDEIKESLNDKKYSVTVYSVNSNIQEGVTLSNLISDGEFKNIQSYWEKIGDATFSYTSYSSKPALLKRNSSTRSYVKQIININEDAKYYFSIRHYQNFTNPVLKTYINNSNISLDTCNSSSNPCTYNSWIKTSNIYTSNINSNVNFVVGDATNNYSGNSYFTEATVINLTAAFGEGSEPNKEWVDNNIDYFEGTLNYIRLDKIKNGNDVEVKFSPYNEFKNYQINCDTAVSTQMSNPTNIDGREYYTLKIKGVTQDTVCHVDWSK